MTHSDYGVLNPEPPTILARFQFIEVLFRIAKHKFFDTGEFKTIYRSFEALLNEHISLLDTPDMWQEFRD